MKKKQTLWFLIMLCWWGLLFPELTFTEDSLRVVQTSEEVEDSWEESMQLDRDQWETYVDFLGAEPQQVKFKSKIWDFLKSLW
ncbi:MAG: hypothetical protein IJY10_05105 [Lachnospiraceae bacterium]|nr:hypothetical protein [Lachnospiraceae bacterium]